jgi:hypothetical protein
MAETFGYSPEPCWFCGATPTEVDITYVIGLTYEGLPLFTRFTCEHHAKTLEGFAELDDPGVTTRRQRHAQPTTPRVDRRPRRRS